jgi:hypothetical protein
MRIRVNVNLSTLRARVAALAASLALGAIPVAAGAATSCTWSIVPSVDGGTNGNVLYGAGASTIDDAWAVGSYTLNGAQTPLTEHWTGAKWTRFAAPNAGPYDNVLAGVAVLTATNTWAVGYYYTGSRNEPLIEHWNGVKWSVFLSPTISSTYGAQLNAVAFVSPTNIYAVGWIYTSYSGTTQSLIEHWNGAAWTVVPSPNVTGSIVENLGSISVVNADDIWVGAVYVPAGGSLGIHRNLSLHWNGKTWAIVLPLNENTSSNNINGIAAFSTGVFATGDYYDYTTADFRTLAEYYNGTKWVNQASANIGKVQTDLFGIAGVSPTEVVSVGSYFLSGVARTFAMRWTGTGVSYYTPPNLGATANFFNGAYKIPGTTDVWAVGGTDDSSGNPDQGLIERYHC